MKKKVLISGAGIAGIIAAITLDKEKYDIELIEEAPVFRNLGFSILLWDSGFQLLNQLFAAHNLNLICCVDYFTVSGFDIYWGNHLKRLKNLKFDEVAYIFERGHLMDLLISLLLKTLDNHKIHFSKSIKSINTQQVSSARVNFNDGAYDIYDIIIIAEGIHSSTRNTLFTSNLNLRPQKLFYAWLETPTKLANQAAVFFMKGYLGVLHPPSNKNLIGFYFNANRDPEICIEEFKSKLYEMFDDMYATKIKINFQTSRIFDLFEVKIKKWYVNNVLLIGDAAHGRPPTIGFGTSLAIEDAVYISSLFNKNYIGSKSDDLFKVYKKFNRQRLQRVRQVYRFQNLIHCFLTGSKIKSTLLYFLLLTPFSNFLKKRVAKIATFKLDI